MALFALFQWVLPVPAGLERIAWSSVGILLACVVLWVTQVVPFIVSVIFIIFMLPMCGVFTLAEIYPMSMTSVVFICLFSFFCSAAVMATPIPYRVAGVALRWAKDNPRKLIVGFTLATAFLSMFISDLAAAAIFIGIGETILLANGDEKQKSEFGKAITVATGAGAAIGGVGTPIGNSLNVLSMNMVNSFFEGANVTFAGWCIMGIPVALGGAALAGLAIGRIYKCDPIKPEAVEVARNLTSEFGKMGWKEYKVIIWLVVIFAILIATTWVPQIQLVLVMFAGILIGFIPGIDFCTKEEYYSSISWDVVMMIMGVTILSNAIVGTGVANWFVDAVLGGANTWPMLLSVFVMCVVTAILHVAIPSGPPCASIAVPLMLALAANTGVAPAVVAMIGGILGGVTTVIPIDLVMLIPYEKGWISMSDWIKKAWVSTAILIVICTLWLPLVAPFFSY
ncbi:MAG: SLC13 family permease [Eggerthellaceae bacterium]|nr:SLC13 family permease [Eggerthellaceae bacterium]